MQLAELEHLRSRDFERFLFAIDSAVIVRNRSQFYLWVQGGLQSFLPHETLLCTFGELGSTKTRGEAFCSSLIDNTRLALLCQKSDNLLSLMSQQWLSRGDRPLVVCASESSHAAKMLATLGYVKALCHGCKEPGRGNLSAQGSMFVMLQSTLQPRPSSTNWIELLLPYLHVAWLRACDNDSNGEISPNAAVILSLREQQVLQWVREGKTNHEIGYILSISPLTVKNHVQKILRKLGVTNRTQAVAIGTKNGLFASEASLRDI